MSVFGTLIIATSLSDAGRASPSDSRLMLTPPLALGEVNPRRLLASCCACDIQYRIFDSTLISSSLWRSVWIWASCAIERCTSSSCDLHSGVHAHFSNGGGDVQGEYSPTVRVGVSSDHAKRSRSHWPCTARRCPRQVYFHSEPIDETVTELVSSGGLSNRETFKLWRTFRDLQ